MTNGFDPLLAGEQVLDPDADGLSNLGEQTAGTDPLDADTDDDGYNDHLEIVAGSDPLDPGSIPSPVLVPVLGAIGQLLTGALVLLTGLGAARRRVNAAR